MKSKHLVHLIPCLAFLFFVPLSGHALAQQQPATAPAADAPDAADIPEPITIDHSTMNVTDSSAYTELGFIVGDGTLTVAKSSNGRTITNSYTVQEGGQVTLTPFKRLPATLQLDNATGEMSLYHLNSGSLTVSDATGTTTYSTDGNLVILLETLIPSAAR